jgi:predicted RNA-binding protein associated with RNAse of E/G family
MTHRYGRDGDPVHIDFRKWPDRLHWQFTMRRLGEDEHGLWVWAPAGTAAQRGEEAPQTFRSTAVKLITPDRWWTAIWNEAGTQELYVDISTPVSWNGNRATFVDLDLDVTRNRTSGEISVLDEDEFRDHQVRYAYPPNIVDKARTATARVAVELERGVEPFGEVAARWMRVAIELSRR